MFYMLTIVMVHQGRSNPCQPRYMCSAFDHKYCVYTAFGQILSKVGSRYCSSQVGFHGNSFVFFSSGQSKRLGPGYVLSKHITLKLDIKNTSFV